jgi:hypothetical protein
MRELLATYEIYISIWNEIYIYQFGMEGVLITEPLEWKNAKENIIPEAAVLLLYACYRKL